MILQLRISVVIPTYQCSQYIRQAINSVLAQTYPTRLLEIIVVDDGSTDNTAELLRPYGDQIRYAYQTNRGEAAARNVGIRSSHGEFVAFLDADDYWLPDRLSVMTKMLGEDIDRMVTTDFLLDVAGSVADTPYYQQNGLRWVFNLEPSEQMKVAVEKCFLLTSLMMVPRDVFQRLGMFDESLRFGEDWDMWLRCLAANQRTVFVPEPYAVYRSLRQGSITATMDGYTKAIDRVRVLSRYRRFVSKEHWQNELGLLHHLGLKETWTAREYGAAMQHAFPLFLNPTYLRTYLQRRRARPESAKKAGSA